MEVISILIDADIILEALLNRDKKAIDAIKLFEFLECNLVIGYITDIGLERICCWCSKLSDSEAAQTAILEIQKLIKIFPVTSILVHKARQLTLKDFESAVEITCASNSRIFGALVTQYPDNFSGASLPILEITDLQHRLSLEKSLGVNSSQCSINTAYWLQDELDETAENLSWQLTPIRATNLRSVTASELISELIINQLESCGLNLPIQAKGAYKEIILGQNALRLYTIVWDLGCFQEELEWTMVIILEQNPLINNILLTISDDSQELIVQELSNSHGFTYAQIIGTWDEKFWVTISATNGFAVNLPPFCFSPDF